MRKSNLTLFSLLLVGASCTKAPVQESLITSWEKDSPKEVVLERALASTNQSQCLKQIFSVDTLKSQIQEIERKYTSASRVRGRWRHLDLEDLTVPQANFLKDYGDKIGDLRDDSIDYSGCESVPCIYNRIYGTEGAIAGYVHYLWYLKFGHMLSADNLIPVTDDETTRPGEYNGKFLTIDKYLYNEQELYALWRLSLMLKSPQTTLKVLKEVQRVPRGEDFEGEKYKGACGLAYSRGWIKLTDGCLRVANNQDLGYLYQAVTHELNHHVDFEGGKNSKVFYRSHEMDYAQVAGFKLVNEFVNYGQTTREWSKDPSIKLVTNYAGSSPQENFAESLAMFRVDGDLTRSKITEDHFNWVSSNYYQSRSFEREALMKQWLEEYSLETGKAVLTAVSDCNSVSSSPKSAFFRNTDFSAPVLPGMLNCIGNSAWEISKMLKAKITLYQPEGCLALNDSPEKVKWDPLIKSHLKLSFDKYLVELQKDKDYLKRIEEFRRQLSDKKIAKNAFVNCFEEMNEEACYENEVKTNAYLKAETLKLPPDQTQEMADMYVSYHPYKVTKDETLKSYQFFVTSNLEAIRQEAQFTWENCAGRSHDNTASPRVGLFDVGAGHMVSSFYNCLNSELPRAVQTVVRNFSAGGNQLVNSKEELILTREVQPRLVKFTQESYEVERDKEVNLALDFMSEDKGKLRKEVLSNFNWATNLLDSKQVLKDCRKEALGLIGMKFLFNTKEDVFGNYIETKTCANITESEEIDQQIEKSKAKFTEQVLNGLEEKLYVAGSLEARRCINRDFNVPILGRYLFKKKRIDCLMSSWSAMEDQVLGDLAREPMVVKLRITREALSSRADRNRSDVQDRVIIENFN